MTTLRPCSSLWRRTRSTILAGTVALSTLLTPVGVAIADSPDSAGSPGVTISVSDASELSGLTAQISTDGDALNLRAEPSSDSAVVATLHDGAIVDLRVDVLDTVYDDNGTRWWPVAVGGETGWVSGFYLVEPGASASTSTSTSNAPLFKGVPAAVSETATSAPASSFSWDGSTLTGATARVNAGEAGDGLNLRAAPDRGAEIIATIPDGTVIDLRIDMTDTVYDEDGVTRWWPAMFDGSMGWVAGSYLISAGADSGSAPAAEPAQQPQFAFDGGSLSGATAVVSTDDDSLLLRAEPSVASDILDRLPDGTIVDLRIDRVDTVYGADGVTRWWPVTFDGQDGWVSGFYLSDGTGASPSAGTDGTSGATDSPTDAREAFTWDGSELGGATAVVAANGDDVNVRSEPTDGSDVVRTVQDGATVNLRIADVDTVVGADGVTRWWPIEVDGDNGWISGFYLSDGGTTSSDAETISAAQTSSSQAPSVFEIGSTARVQTESGQGLRVRAAAGTDSEQLFSVAEGNEVTIIGGPVSFDNSVNGWFEISANGSTGFVDGDLLALVATPEPTPVSVTSTAVPTESLTPEPELDIAPESRTAPTPTPEPTEANETASPLDDQPTLPPTETSMVDETPAPTETSMVDGTLAPNEAPAETPAPTLVPAEVAAGPAFIVPVPGATLTQNFGCSSLGFYPYNPEWGCGVHDGIDYAAPAYTPILASASGTVVTAGWCDCGLGYYVEIDHGNGVHTIYGHMATQPYVSAGQQVAQGETIGPIGSTGLSTGPHVHFMVQVNGVSQDPARYLG